MKLKTVEADAVSDSADPRATRASAGAPDAVKFCADAELADSVKAVDRDAENTSGRGRTTPAT